MGIILAILFPVFLLCWGMTALFTSYTLGIILAYRLKSITWNFIISASLFIACVLFGAQIFDALPVAITGWDPDKDLYERLWNSTGNAILAMIATGILMIVTRLLIFKIVVDSGGYREINSLKSLTDKASQSIKGCFQSQGQAPKISADALAAARRNIKPRKTKKAQDEPPDDGSVGGDTPAT